MTTLICFSCKSSYFNNFLDSTDTILPLNESEFNSLQLISGETPWKDIIIVFLQLADFITYQKRKRDKYTLTWLRLNSRFFLQGGTLSLSVLWIMQSRQMYQATVCWHQTWGLGQPSYLETGLPDFEICFLSDLFKKLLIFSVLMPSCP